MGDRTASLTRETKETRVAVDLNIDGTGHTEVNTGIGMLDHLLTSLAHHGFFDLRLSAEGDLQVDAHHTVEDIAILLGQAFRVALGERRGIVRMAHAYVPLDEALALVVVDLSGRGFPVIEVEFGGEKIGELPSALVRHFLETLAYEGHMNLHVRLLNGYNDHHRVEAIFKALAKALDAASRSEERALNQIPSTKGKLE